MSVSGMATTENKGGGEGIIKAVQSFCICDFSSQCQISGVLITFVL